jgi:phosphopentomutase
LTVKEEGYEMSRFIINVLDSFGVGAMRDVPIVRPADIGANTAQHIIDSQPNIKIPTLEKLGLMNILNEETDRLTFSKKANYGKANLTHHGADSFLGHQEISGTTPKEPLNQAFNEVIDEVADHLKNKGYHVRYVGEKNEPKILVVNEVATVGDNLETDLGQVYNVSSALDDISFEEVIALGKTVREIVKVSRVITFGGHGIHLENLLAARKVIGEFAGVDAPESGVYNDGYHVIHLGYGIDPNVQIPTILDKAGIPVELFGKAADIIQTSSKKLFPGVDTETLYDQLIAEVKANEDGFFFINIQETDLAGHAEDVARYADRLEASDKKIAELLDHLNEGDILVVMADHGNDPTIGHSQHTREFVPLLVYSKGIEGKFIGERDTMADVAATAAEFFDVAMPQHGHSFLDKLNISGKE